MLHQPVIKPDFTQLIDHDHRPFKFRSAQPLRQQRCFATAQKSGEDQDWDLDTLGHGGF